MSRAPQGGGGYGFDPSDPNTYHSVETRGTGSIDTTMHWTSHSVLGYTTNDGKADALRKVQKGIKLQNLQDKTDAWKGVQTHTDGIATRLSKAYSDTFAAWSGDDADTAQTTFSHTVDSASAISDYSGNVHSGMSQITTGAKTLLSAGSSGPSTGAEIANFSFGTGAGGDGDGGAAVQHYEDFVTAVDSGRNDMPQSMQWQVKTQAGSGTGGQQPTTTTPTSPGGKTGVSGVSAPHSGVATPGHGEVQSPHITQPTTTPHAGKVPGKTDPPPGSGGGGGGGLTPPTTDPGSGGTGGVGGGSGGGGVPGLSGVGAGHGGGGIGSLPHVGTDSGSTLAGLDGGAGGGGAGLGAGGGGLGAGGGVAGLGAGAGAGAGGLGAGGGAGLLAGGAGLGTGGGSGTRSSGVGSAAGAGGAGANGAGRGAGMMPMRGGGAGGGGDDDERERSTWLEEDDDVWGESDAPPSVIS